MSWRDLFGGRRGSGGFPARVAAGDLVQFIPPDATYVTFGEVMALADVLAYNGGPAGAGWGHGRDPSWRPGPADGQRHLGLLVLRPGELLVVGAGGVERSIPVERLTAVDAGRRIGFVLFCSDGTGLEVGQQVPVRAQPPATFATTGRVTNQFGGWEATLAPFGVSTHW